MFWGNETKSTSNLPKTLNCISNCSKVSVISWAPLSKLFNLIVLKEKKKGLSGYPITTGILKSSDEVAWNRVEKKVKILIYFPYLSNTFGAKSFQHVDQSLILDYFLMHTIFKVFIEFVTISLLFYALDFWPQGMWDLISPTRDQTCIPCIGTQSLNHSTTGKFPRFFLYAYNKIFVILWLFNYLTTNHFSYFS